MGEYLGGKSKRERESREAHHRFSKENQDRLYQGGHTDSIDLVTNQVD